VFRTHFDVVRAAPAESNAAALESALGCLISFLKYSDDAGKVRPMVLPVLIEKCLANGRTGIRAKCLEALLFFVELDTSESVIAELAAFMTHKQPKLIAACLAAVADIVRYRAGQTCVVVMLMILQ
jgi:cytoskeleton-associated protein 5